MALGSSARAQSDVSASLSPDAPVAPWQELGYGALPGSLHVPSAETLPKGSFDVGALGGFGYRKGLLAADERFGRGLGDLAISYAPIDGLMVALSLDGRYDRHYGENPSPDDGYVGDPHILIRGAKPIGSFHLGGQVGIWVPGKDAPSVAGSAISVDVRGIGSLPVGSGLLSFEAGFRFDNSANSVTDAVKLSASDRVSLGVSSFNALLAGVHLMVPTGKLFFGAEASTDVFVGSGAPGAILRANVSLGFRVNDSWSALAFVEAAHVPGLSYTDVMAGDITLIPYEPAVTGGLGLQGRFGGPRRAAGSVTHNEHPEDVQVIEYADLTGGVTDEAGKPIIGATVTAKLKNNTGTAVTDDKGAYTITKLPIGKTVAGKTVLDDTGAEVSVAVDGKRPASSTLTLVKGSNAAAKLVLETILPPGQLKALVRSLANGKPIPNATIKIEPGGKKLTSGADGAFAIDLAPGQYKITVTAPGMAVQELDVTIEQNGVTIKNIDLHK
jgi:hypothetical protein